MNWIKQNWKWALLVVIIIIIFVAVKYKNRPIAVKIPDTTPTNTKVDANTTVETQVSHMA